MLSTIPDSVGAQEVLAEYIIFLSLVTQLLYELSLIIILL